LPEYVGEHLSGSPLVLVATQINFEEVGREVTHGQARQFQRAIGGGWTQLMAAPLLTTTMTPTGAVNEPPRQAYRLSTTDGTWSALLNPDSVTVETRAYPGWESMRDTMEAFANAVADVYDPSSELRLGLRYVDQVVLPEGRDGWEGLIPESLLGIAKDPHLGSGVLASDQRVLLQVADDTRCVFRHGLLADEAGVLGRIYLLDYDVFRDRARPYEAASVIEGADELHGFAGGLFRASVSDELYALMRG
jgi:uncharacterized protein (TIGR04255 family)